MESNSQNRVWPHRKSRLAGSRQRNVGIPSGLMTAGIGMQVRRSAKVSLTTDDEIDRAISARRARVRRNDAVRYYPCGRNGICSAATSTRSYGSRARNVRDALDALAADADLGPRVWTESRRFAHDSECHLQYADHTSTALTRPSYPSNCLHPAMNELRVLSIASLAGGRVLTRLMTKET